MPAIVLKCMSCIISLILRTILWCRYYHLPHTDEKAVTEQEKRQTTVVLRLTCPPGVRVLQGESQPIVYGSHLDNRLFHHYPVCVLKSKERLNTSSHMCLRPFKVAAKHPISTSSGISHYSTSEPVSTLLPELSTRMAPLTWLVQGSQSPFLILEKVHFPSSCHSRW